MPGGRGCREAPYHLIRILIALARRERLLTWKIVLFFVSLYDAYYNLSLPVPDTPVNYRIHELLNMATKAWTRTYWGRLPVVYNVRNRLMGLMSFPKLALQLKLDFSVILGPLFYTWVVQMLLPSLLQQLVYEKEKRLRMIMKMHGLGDGAYWLVTYLWYLMVYIVYMVFFVVFGTLIRLKVFTTTPFSIQAVLFFIFGNNMLAFVFMISSFFSSSRMATVVAVLYIFASGLIGELLLRSLMQQDKSYMLVVQLVPGFALYRGLFEFSEYSTRAVFATFPGLKWSNLRDPGNGMLSVWVSLLAEWPLFIALGWYFEQVLNNGTGARRHPLFFLRWMWRKVCAAVGWGGVPCSPEPNADLWELQRMQPHATAVVEMAPGRGGAAAAPSMLMAEELKSPPQAGGMSKRGEDLIPDATDVNGGGKGADGADATDRRRRPGRRGRRWRCSSGGGTAGLPSTVNPRLVVNTAEGAPSPSGSDRCISVMLGTGKAATAAVAGAEEVKACTVDPVTFESGGGEASGSVNTLTYACALAESSSDDVRYKTTMPGLIQLLCPLALLLLGSFAHGHLVPTAPLSLCLGLLGWASLQPPVRTCIESQVQLHTRLHQFRPHVEVLLASVGCLCAMTQSSEGVQQGTATYDCAGAHTLTLLDSAERTLGD
ncbi:hypothetical protein VOLCADRAFT_101115 [Volvox carteri f. nagariensis]|uniref:ABC-2 type transporter transmembrane domain-containing protein n=1 Tax=Volvox carteri f. nagariensis TaxID=3068 RepID=D8ULT0_VOLCA|nr:uncharacterized protein VOLCADRAFT_101115 [Volvox carteri f. nagariensis]EFJ39320.1 hypothetical protein VOLCADRAFT_101115 [Volvox carteri f. nagariensis]|eukprot:XP_002959616.1 hypothetical protein VOLCADRAFT_101115 [Volvox carteri f. nagariensis]